METINFIHMRYTIKPTLGLSAKTNGIMVYECIHDRLDFTKVVSTISSSFLSPFFHFQGFFLVSIQRDGKNSRKSNNCIIFALRNMVGLFNYYVHRRTNCGTIRANSMSSRNAVT